MPENYTVFLTNPHIWHAIHFANEIKFPAVLTLIENPLMKIEIAEAEGFHSGLLRVFLSFFFFFCYFFGPLLRHMEVPRLGVESEL